MANHNESKASILARDQGLIGGFPKRFGAAQNRRERHDLRTTSAVAVLQSRVGAATQVLLSRAAYLADVKAADAEESATAATVSGLVEAIYVAFGEDPAALADFGLPVRKKASMTPAQHLAAGAKAKATRAARHTMGPKQKLAITGAAPAAAAPVASAGERAAEK